jgi:hypothetical protein
MILYLVILLVVIAVSFALALRAARRKGEAPTVFDNIVLAIRVPKTNEKDARSAEQMFASLHGLLKVTPEVQEHLALEIVSSVEGINFYAVVPRTLRTFVESQIYAQYPEAEIKEAEDYSQKIDPSAPAVEGTYLKLEKESIFPIRTFPDFEVDPLAAITGAISDLSGGEQVWLQILLRPLPDVWQEEGHQYIEKVREGVTPTGINALAILDDLKDEAGALVTHFVQSIFTAVPEATVAEKKEIAKPMTISAGQELELKAIEDKISHLGFEVLVRIGTLAPDGETAAGRLRSTLASFRQFSTANLNSFTRGEPVADKEKFLEDYRRRLFDPGQSYILNTFELASVFHLPSVSVETPAIAWTASRRGEPPLNLPTQDCTYFARTNFRDQMVNFGIKEEDRRRHIYLVGKTGTGKTTVFKNMIVQDMEEGRGVGILDPHGDLVKELLDFVPNERVEDVVLVDPSDAEQPVGINLLECPDPSQKNLMASGLVTAVKKHFDYSWGPRLEYLLNNAILTLLEVPGTTLLGITRLLMDKNYQKYIVYQIKDPVLRDFWEKEFKQMMGNVAFHTEAIQPIQNKVGRFLAASTIRNILGQARSSVRFDEIMNGEKILFVNLAKGKIGEDNANLLGSLIISHLNFIAMQRVRIPEAERRDFYLYADEFQNFASGSFASILSEARKYRLCLNLTHQYTAQLPEEMQDAIFGNVGTMISFALGAPDAKVLAPEFAPTFDENDLITLDKYNIYVKLMIDGMTSPPFSGVTMPPPEETTGNAQRVVGLSREKYGRPVAQVEAAIREWTEKQFDLGQAKAEEARARKQAKAEKNVTDRYAGSSHSPTAKVVAKFTSPPVSVEKKESPRPSLEGEIRLR